MAITEPSGTPQKGSYNGPADIAVLRAPVTGSLNQPANAGKQMREQSQESMQAAKDFATMPHNSGTVIGSGVVEKHL